MSILKNIIIGIALAGASLTAMEISPKPAKAYPCDCQPIRQLPNGKTLYICCGFNNCYNHVGYFPPASGC